MFKKKSQISIFIIISTIIIIVGITSLYFFKDDLLGEAGSVYKNSIRGEIERCVNDELENSITFLGVQGGYLDIPKNIKINPERYTNFGIKIPNWDSDINEIPTIKSMEVSINNYLLNTTEGCIESSINSLKEVYDINIDFDEFRIDTKIGLDNIAVEIFLPIDIKDKNADEIFYLNKYQFGIDEIYLGQEYNLAKKIFEKQIETSFLENIIIDQIKSNNNYKIKESMPTEGIYIDCSPRIWTYFQLKKNLVSSNNNNFRYLQIKDTFEKNLEYESNFKKEYGNLEYKQYFENFYNIDINLGDEYKNFKVEFVTPISTSGVGLDSLFGFRKFKVTP